MPFSKLLGNERVKQALEKMILHNSIPSTLLFEGIQGVGKRAFAEAFAASVMGEKSLSKIKLGVHPDFHILTPEGKTNTHPIENLRKMMAQAFFPPSEALASFFIIEQAEKMLPVSSNALLKILEEPPEKSYFILLTEDKEALLPTLLSRARKLSFFPLLQKEIQSWLMQEKKLSESEARKLAFLSHGSLGRALLLSQEKPFVWKEDLLSLFSTCVQNQYPEFVAFASKIETHMQESLQESDLLQEIAMWYRDLHLVKVGGGIEHLYHLGSLDLIKQALSKEIPPMEKVLEGIGEIRLGLQRSIHLRHLLERFFLMLERPA